MSHGNESHASIAPRPAARICRSRVTRTRLCATAVAAMMRSGKSGTADRATCNNASYTFKSTGRRSKGESDLSNRSDKSASVAESIRPYSTRYSISTSETIEIRIGRFASVASFNTIAAVDESCPGSVKSQMRTCVSAGISVIWTRCRATRAETLTRLGAVLRRFLHPQAGYHDRERVPKG